jgi:hypothetical protein
VAGEPPAGVRGVLGGAHDVGAHADIGVGVFGGGAQGGQHSGFRCHLGDGGDADPGVPAEGPSQGGLDVVVVQAAVGDGVHQRDDGRALMGLAGGFAAGVADEAGARRVGGGRREAGGVQGGGVSVGRVTAVGDHHERGVRADLVERRAGGRREIALEQQVDPVRADRPAGCRGHGGADRVVDLPPGRHGEGADVHGGRCEGQAHEGGVAVCLDEPGHQCLPFEVHDVGAGTAQGEYVAGGAHGGDDAVAYGEGLGVGGGGVHGEDRAEDTVSEPAATEG